MTQYVYGKNVVKQILSDSDRAKVIYLSSRDAKIEDMAKKRRVTVKMIDRRTMEKMAKSDHHQGVLAEIEPYRTYSVDEILAAKPEGKHGLLIMLDELEDPHNLGAILRTADAAGADGVIFKKNNAVGLTPTVAKVSAGAIDTVKCAAVTNLSRTCEELKKKGWWIIGADMDGTDYRGLSYDMDVVLIIGNEGKGISRLLEKQCDYIVSLPMAGKISSLNASISAGILMYEIYSMRFPLQEGGYGKRK